MTDAWDIAALALKILAIAAGITGVALPALDAANIKLVELSRGQLIAVTLAFITTAVLLGALDYTIGRRSDREAAHSTKPDPAGPSLTVYGGNVTGNSFSNSFNQVTINSGDSPAERERKRKLAERMVAEEVIGAVSALDSRLAFIDTTLAADPFAEQLKSANDRVAPAASQTWGSGYRILISQQRAASLRGAFNSQPLRTELREPLLRQMQEINIDSSAARAFYDALVAVNDKSEDLLAIVNDPASSDESTITGRRLLVQRDTVRAASEWAYLTGLRLLDSLQIKVEPWLAARLASLRELEPRRLPSSQAELGSLMDQAVQQASAAMHAKAALLEEARGMQAQDLERLRKETDEALRIKPGDPWNVVVGKAKSLRNLGRTEEAVRDYAAYAEMFASTDPTAERFSRTAQSFTREMSRLGVKGGIYVYHLQDGTARRAGLLEGDIIIACGNHDVSDMPAFQKVCQERPPGAALGLTFLRLLSDGTFVRGNATLSEGSLEAGLMPI
jgi:hypothetical protein